MVGGLGPLEVSILLLLFFVLFGAQRLPELANALGRVKGEPVAIVPRKALRWE